MFKEMCNCSRHISTGMKLHVMIKWLAPVVHEISGCHSDIFSGFFLSLQHMTTCATFSLHDHFTILLYITCTDETTVLNAIVTQSRYEENFHIYSVHNLTCRPSSFLVL